jgi:hypothetical protein
MDTAQQYLAAYQSPSSLPRSTHALLTASIDSPWHQPQPNSTPSSGTSSQLFMSTSSTLVDYTSPSPSSPFADFHAGHQSPSIQTNHPSNSFSDLSPQVESSSGPIRGALTRRKARIAQVSQPGRANREAEVSFYVASLPCF